MTQAPTDTPTDTPTEVETVTKTRIHCDGGAGGHPRVWLQIDPTTGEVVCPYCDKVFRLAKAAGGGH